MNFEKISIRNKSADMEKSLSENINILQSLNIYSFQKCQITFNNGRKEIYTLSDKNKDIFQPNGLLVTTGMVNNVTVIDIDDMKNPRVFKLNKLCRATGTSYTKTVVVHHLYIFKIYKWWTTTVHSHSLKFTCH